MTPNQDVTDVADLDVVELGVASEATKGSLFSGAEAGGRHQPTGISDID